MMRFTWLISTVATFVLATSLAFGHGGNYTGPGGEGSGGGFAPSGGGTPGPGPGPAGSGSGGAGSSGPGGNGTTGGTSGGPAGEAGGSTGTAPGGPGGGNGAPGAPGAPGSPVGTTGQRKKAASNANLTWAAWWFFNDDRFVDLKTKLRKERNNTVNPDLFTGAEAWDEIAPVNAKQIRDKINPVLRFALKDPFFDTRAAALIALGKTGFDGALADMKEHLDDNNKVVRESACLAMGILGDKKAIPTLIEIMKDSKEGREILGRKNGALHRTRAFAAIALGLIGTRHADLTDTPVFDALVEQIDRKIVHRDNQVAPIVALGLLGNKEAVPYLIRFLKDRSQNAVARSYAATSLGKLKSPAAIPALLKGLKDKHAAVTQSSAIALGLLAKPKNSKVTRSLQKLVKSAPDIGAKNFAIMSMAEIGGPDNFTELNRMARRGNLFMRTFAALGLAVWMDKSDDRSEKENVCRRLHKFFKNEKNPDIRGASAIALGIMRYDKAGHDILKALRRGGQASLLSHYCTSLGLMNFDLATQDIRDTVTSGGDLTLRRTAAIALGLLGDRGALKVLEGEISDSSRSKAVLGAVTQGLGFIGDVSAVPTLVKFVRDRNEYHDVTRAFAAVALGLLGDKDNIPALSAVAEHNNYLQRTEALSEILTIL